MLGTFTVLLLLASAFFPAKSQALGAIGTACWTGPDFTELIHKCGFIQIAFESLPPSNQRLYTGDKFTINATLSMLGSKIVPSEGGFLIPHANVRMCKTEGRLCVCYIYKVTMCVI
jgi:hypothetical protein